jgi:steroid delta-isomerase-like uncharacterized protein
MLNPEEEAMNSGSANHQDDEELRVHTEEVEPHGLKEVVSVGAVVAALAGGVAGTAAAAGSGAGTDSPNAVLVSPDVAPDVEVAQMYFDQVWSGNPDGGERLGVNGYEIFGPQADTDQGGCTKRIAAIVDEYRQGFPDLHFDVQNVTADGDTVTLDWVATGTHRGTFWGIEPTSVDAKVAGSTTYTFENGSITREVYRFDVAGLFAQLGSRP